MKIIKYLILAFTLSISLTNCKDYLDTTSPSNIDYEFVTSTPSETYKTLSWCYANYRQNCIMGTYLWNDVVGSDAETYPESGSSNNTNAKLKPEDMTIDAVSGGFNGLYTTLARAIKVAEIISEKDQFKADVAAGEVTDWTQLYGEATTMWAFCYFQLVKHFGDVPYGFENTYVYNYELSSRFDIYDNLISALKEVAPLMYTVGDGGITAERLSQTFSYALAGQIALYAGGYQTIRTDVDGLYGEVSFTTKGSEENGCVYARRSDYLDYYKLAEQYFTLAKSNAGTVQLITSDNRSYADNPFQRHFQYFHDLEVSPESLFEIGNKQGGQSGQTTNSEYPYAFGRPSDGGTSNAAPCKTFGAVRIIPTVYYGEFEAGDKRRDVSVAVTGSKGDGNEILLSFLPGNKSNGGIAINKWDENRMYPPYTAKSRQSGINYPILRMADVNLMLAEVYAVIGDNNQGAMDLVNDIRERAFGDTNHNISGLSGEDLLNAVLQERKLELLGEGTRRWDLIRNGLLSERAVAVHEEMAAMVASLETNDYYQFANGNVISNYVYIKSVQLDNSLTYDCTDESNLALFPGWRGQYDYTTIAAVSGKVKGTNHNLEIRGLFNYNDPNPEIDARDYYNTITDEEGNYLHVWFVDADGYEKRPWGKDIVENYSTYQDNILSGVTSASQPPRYYWPIPSETLSYSGGKVTNGYGLPNN